MEEQERLPHRPGRRPSLRVHCASRAAQGAAVASTARAGASHAAQQELAPAVEVKDCEKEERSPTPSKPPPPPPPPFRHKRRVTSFTDWVTTLIGG